MWKTSIRTKREHFIWGVSQTKRAAGPPTRLISSTLILIKQMERILLHHLEKYCSSQGGPQHGCNWSDSALYNFSQNWMLYGFSRSCSQLWNLCLQVSLHPDHFALERETRWLEQALSKRWGISLRFFFFAFHPPIQRLLFRNLLCFVRFHFRVIFPRLVLFLYQKAKVKTSPLSGIWLPSMSHFFMTCQSLRYFCSNPFHLSLRYVGYKTLPSYYSIHFHMSCLNVTQPPVSFVILVHSSHRRYLVVVLIVLK